jgi:long-chain acyl-CoA synthetase
VLAQSLGQSFREIAIAAGARPLFFVLRNQVPQAISYAEALAEVDLVACGFLELGLNPGDRVAILSENRPEWILCDLAVLSVGAVDVPLYPTSSAGEMEHILSNSGARFLVVSNAELLARITPVLSRVTGIERVITFDAGSAAKTLSWSQLIEMGRRRPSESVLAALAQVKSSDLATIIYTSGTTGPPKGVMLSHGNFLANCEAMTKQLEVGPSDRSLSFLPLSHCFERTAGHYGFLSRGAQIAYAENMNSVAQDMVKMQPTILLGVPRLYEKMRSRILERVEQAPRLRRFLFSWGLSIGRRVFFARERRQRVGWTLRLRHAIARRLVFRPVRKALGGRLRFFVSGGAPLAPEVVEFFEAMGVTLLEGYGLTETTPVVSCNQPQHRKLASVGRALPGVEVRIAPTGEILVRGPNVMQGYYKLPQETSRVIDEDGFFHTGDVGHVDADGFIFITDRLKDLIITAGGKNVSPQNIENRIKLHGLIEQACLIGDRRPYLTALIVPNRDALLAAAARVCPGVTELRQLIHLPAVATLFQEAVASVNDDLASFERIKRFALLAEPFSQDRGELTPTLKIKRRVVEANHKDIIERMYAADLPVPAVQPDTNQLPILSGLRSI